MGCDIHAVAQKRVGDKWETLAFEPFDDGRSYAVFGWLAGVRNYSAVTPISEPRGYPDDFDVTLLGDDPGDPDDPWRPPHYDMDYHSRTWLSMEELLAVDYEQVVEDRRVTRQMGPNWWSGGETCDPGEGENMTLREFLGEWYFRNLDRLAELGADRIVFAFDN